MKGFNWGCGGTSQSAKYYRCRCHNRDWIGSVTNCIESQGANFSQAVRDQAYRHVEQRCVNKGRVDYSVDVLKYLQENATSYLQEATDADIKTLVTHPLAVNATQFAYPDRSFNHIYAQVIRSQAYAWGFVFFITFFLVVGSVFNVMRLFLIRYTSNKRSNGTGGFLNKIRACIINPNLIHSSFVKLAGPYAINIPTRLDAIIIALFVCYEILATTTGYSIELPNIYQNGRNWQLWDLIGYRTALNSFALIPPTFFFGIRNNPFIQMTGSSVTRFLHFHKWLAWSMSLQALIHSGVWTAYTIKEGDYKSWAVDAYWRWGIVGTTLCFLMIGLSHYWFRSLCYEVFLLIHKTFAIIFIIAMWYHCNIMGWMGWIYATIVIWGYDRIVRFLSILFNGGVKPAKITKLNEELVRVVVEAPNKNNDYWFAGSHAYIYFLNVHTRFYQSHPFSVMKSKRFREKNCFAFVFKTQKGITKKIMEVLEADYAMTKSPSKYINVLVEGPYGAYSPLVQHDQYVFVAGGIGISPIYSQLVDIIERNETQRNYKRLLKLIWVVRTEDYYEFFKEDIDYLLDNGVEIEIHVTRSSFDSPHSTFEASESSSNSEEHPGTRNEEQIELINQKHETHHTNEVKIIQNQTRPSLRSFIEAVDVSQASTMFVASGPSSFNDEVRSSVNFLISKSHVRIDFKEDSFNY